MLPGCLLYLALAAGFPEVLASAVPSDFLMQRLDLPWLRIVFYVVVFGTLVETATAFIHAANERIAGGYTERGKVMPPWLRAVVALTALLFAVTLASQIGLIDLIAKGYGTLTWVFIAVFILPLCTVGVWKIRNRGGAPGAAPERIA
jgi:uncharacterized membrane protein YkvI